MTKFYAPTIIGATTLLTIAAGLGGIQGAIAGRKPLRSPLTEPLPPMKSLTGQSPARLGGQPIVTFVAGLPIAPTTPFALMAMA